MEKIEPPLTKMHRPIIRSETASSAEILFLDQDLRADQGIVFDHDSYAKMKYRDRVSDIEVIHAKVSVFNPNTSNGRLFVPDIGRTIPFYLTYAARSSRAFRLIGESYSLNLNDRDSYDSIISFDVLKTFSKTGRLTKFSVIRVYKRR